MYTYVSICVMFSFACVHDLTHIQQLFLFILQALDVGIFWGLIVCLISGKRYKKK